MKEPEKRYRQSKLYRSAEGDAKTVEGYAIVFNQRANIADMFWEIVEQGAIMPDALVDVPLFVNHDVDKLPLARYRVGDSKSTMSLNVDERGLLIKASLDVDNNPNAASLYSSVNRGDCSGMSFAFTVADEQWQDLESEMPTRIIKRFERIYEVSPVTYPAYDSTDIAARAKFAVDTAKKKLEGKSIMTNFDRELLLKHGFNPDEKDPEELVKNLITARNREADYVIEERRRNQKNFSSAEAERRFIDSALGFVGSGQVSYFGSARETQDSNKNSLEQREKMGRYLKEKTAVQSPLNIVGETRTLTIGSQSIVVPKYASDRITPDFPVVSSLVDAVAHLSLNGGESFSQPFVTSIAAGGYTTEGQDYNVAETSFDFAAIDKVKLTAYAELTEEFEKLPAAAYADTVFQNIRTSIREVLAREILWGEGVSATSKKITGIFSEQANAIDPATDLTLSEIDDTTLNEIIYHYGGNEDVEGSPAVLILNKLDMLAFARVRTASNLPFYSIEYSSGNGGKINGVSFVLNSNCKPLSVASGGAESGEYSMCYGNPQNYQLVEFSPLEVKKSEDFKFRQGMTAFKGSVLIGGNCVKRNGFIRIRRG